jgi:hypothetical protein
MLKFLQDEFAGLKVRWLRVLTLLTCLVMALVVAQQERAIEAQGSLISSLSGDSNRLQQMQGAGKSQPSVSVYITDSRIPEPASKPPQPPQRESRTQPSPARVMRHI